MKLTHLIRPLHEGIWPVYGGGNGGEYSVYVDLDGVLVDLNAGITRSGSKVHWKNPEAISDAIAKLGGDPLNYDDVAKFYSELPKTPEADAIWSAASKTAKRLFILSAKPPSKYSDILNIEAVDDGKYNWVLNNLDPSPDDIHIVRHGDKSKFAKTSSDVLVDDDYHNISGWRQAGGSAIVHIHGSARGTLSGLANPSGKMDVEIDMDDNEGFSTDLKQFKGGGQAGGFARYSLNGSDYHMTTRAVGNDEDGLWLLAVYSVNDKIQKDLIDAMKSGELKQKHLQKFLDQSAEAISSFFSRGGKLNHTPDIIVVPESSSRLTELFAKAISNSLSTSPDIITMPKNRDPNTIKINIDGATQFAKTKTAHAQDKSKRMLNPSRRELPKDDIRRYEWSASDVVKKWRQDVILWASGKKKSHDLDQFIRRNLSGLYLPPDGFNGRLAGKKPLIVDDVSTFHTTMADIAKSLYETDIVSAPFGAVLWMMQTSS